MELLVNGRGYTCRVIIVINSYSLLFRGRTVWQSIRMCQLRQGRSECCQNGGYILCLVELVCLVKLVYFVSVTYVHMFTCI